MPDEKPPPEQGSAPFNIGNTSGGLNPMLLGSVGLLFLAMGFIVYRLLRLQWDEAAARKRTAALLAMADQDDANNRRVAPVAGRRRRVPQQRVNHHGGDFVDEMMAQDADDIEDMNDDEQGGYFDEETGEKIGKRKAAKLAAKADKKAAREQELIEREERKRRERERDLKLEKEREAERLEELAKEEALKKEREEKERREHEEYLALKASFAVEDEGFDQLGEEEEGNLMKQFIEYVQTSKVVNMDELASHFSLKPEEAVSRLQYFIENGQLQGVMDDRGKFIYITEEELQAVAKFINQRGRVSIHELADYSNKLIRLDAAA